MITVNLSTVLKGFITPYEIIPLNHPTTLIS